MKWEEKANFKSEIIKNKGNNLSLTFASTHFLGMCDRYFLISIEKTNETAMGIAHECSTALRNGSIDASTKITK